jgi:hypothetical protein
LKLSAIAIFAYNRPSYLKKCLISLKLNKLSKKSSAYFFVDFPKSEKDFNNYLKVKKLINDANFFKKKITILRKINYGLKKNILTGINQVLKKNSKIIVLEDDLLLSKHFLEYMNKYLNYFENSKKVASIHGYCYPINNKKLNNFFFLKGADCWGWATWRRAWKNYNDDHLFLAKKIKKMKQIKNFNFNNKFNYYHMLENRSPSTWAVNWYASAFVKNMLTLYPKHSYVRNLGNKGIGVHSKKIDKTFNVSLNNKFKFEKIQIEENLSARKKFEEFFYTNFKTNFFSKVIKILFK